MVLASSAIAYAVAWVWFPYVDDGAAYTVSTVAYCSVMLGVMILAMMSPLVTMLAVYKLDVRSWENGKRALACAVAIAVAASSVPGVLYVSLLLVEPLWSRWPQ